MKGEGLGRKLNHMCAARSVAAWKLFLLCIVRVKIQECCELGRSKYAGLMGAVVKAGESCASPLLHSG